MNLNLAIKQFFEESEYNKLADKIVIIRQDGIGLYSNIQDTLEASSMGALISGVWQAAQALSELTHNKKNYLDFRLGFDTSSDGLYVLPLALNDTTCYLGGVYTDLNNPAKLKQNLRFLKNNLEMYLSEFNLTEEKREGYLFENISDEEMDNLFSFGGV